MLEDKKKILMVGIISIVLIIGGIIYYLMQKQEEEYFDLEQNVEEKIENQMQNEIAEKIEEIIVHITGQVINPGVITLKEGARIMDAINKAGGVTEEADLSQINLAYILEDAQKIYIPSSKEKENIGYISEESGESFSMSDEKTTKKEEKLMININKANEEELQKLPGVGSSTASKIVAYRKENGKFNSIEDIKNVSGIGESKFNKIKNNICVK